MHDITEPMTTDELEAEGQFEMRGRREMDAADIAAELAEMRAEGEEDYEPTSIEMALAKAEAGYNRAAREQAGDSALTNFMGH